jgi:hypothetical protein
MINNQCYSLNNVSANYPIPLTKFPAVKMTKVPKVDDKHKSDALLTGMN